MVSKSKILGKSSLIFVTVGSTNFPFDRLFTVVDNALVKLNSQAKLVVQTGCSTYKWNYKNRELYQSLPPKKMELLFKEADRIITHGGLGTLYVLSKEAKNMPLIVARLKKYREQINNHQRDHILYTSTLFPFEYRDFFSIKENIQDSMTKYVQNSYKKNILAKYLFSSKNNMGAKLDKYIKTL